MLTKENVDDIKKEIRQILFNKIIECRNDIPSNFVISRPYVKLIVDIVNNTIDVINNRVGCICNTPEQLRFFCFNEITSFFVFVDKVLENRNIIIGEYFYNFDGECGITEAVDLLHKIYPDGVLYWDHLSHTISGLEVRTVKVFDWKSL